MKHSKAAYGTKGKSSPMRVNTGSGSRPGGSKFKIPTSAPMNDRTMERAPNKWLK